MPKGKLISGRIMAVVQFILDARRSRISLDVKPTRTVLKCWPVCMCFGKGYIYYLGVVYNIVSRISAHNG